MEGFESNKPSVNKYPDIVFYRRAAFSMLSENQHTAPDDGTPKMSATKAQLNYCHSFYNTVRSRPVRAEELMLIDGYCDNLRNSPSAIGIDELLLNDEYIAEEYASLMAERHRNFPNAENRPSLSEIPELIAYLSQKDRNNPFPYSELDVFSSDSDEEAKLSCLASGCEPVTVSNGICIGKKSSAPKIGGANVSAIVYAAIGQRPADLQKFLNTYEVISSSATIEFCRTDEIFTKLIRRYDDFYINATTLPPPKSSRYAGQPYQFGEFFSAAICDAFLTNELFGDVAVIAHGKRSKVQKLCAVAAKCGLSFFGGIEQIKKPKKADKKINHPALVRINSDLFRVLRMMSGNICATLPDHDLQNVTAEELIPDAREIFSNGNDIFFSSSVSLSSAKLPFHNGFYSTVAPAFYALSRRRDTNVGQLSVSVKASLCFNNKEDSGISLSALLGMYCAVRRFSLPITNLHLSFADGENAELTVTAHDFSEKRVQGPDNYVDMKRIITENVGLCEQKLLKDIKFIENFYSKDDQ